MKTCECCNPEAAAARDAAEAADPTPPMGLHPAAPGCGCHLCLPPTDPLDASEARTVRKVERYGWQIVAVTGGPGPEFAYTVGLPHRAGHPELLMSGHDPAAFGPCLRELAERVLDGDRFTGGEVVEGLLPGVPVLLEPLRRSALADTVIRSRWFHRERVDALQVVWPDPSARFGWQPGADEHLRRGQPASWRVPAGRTGMLAPDPVWPLPTPPDALAVACRHVVEHGAAVLCAARYDEFPDDIWTFSCGAEHGPELTEHTTSHLAHLVRAAPSIAQLAGMPRGRVAERTGPDAPWEVVV